MADRGRRLTHSLLTERKSKAVHHLAEGWTALNGVLVDYSSFACPSPYDNNHLGNLIARPVIRCPIGAGIIPDLVELRLSQLFDLQSDLSTSLSANVLVATVLGDKTLVTGENTSASTADTGPIRVPTRSTK